MEYVDIKLIVCDFLRTKGFVKIAFNELGQDIYRKENNDPRMDIVVGFINNQIKRIK